MEADTRRLQPASVSMFSIETGKERYSLDGHLAAPPFSPWRNNVTALSQRYNLYFVATRDNIAVFVPTFPYQKLGRTPSLVITPTLANKGARGYINQALPHGVNHLLVGDLGHEEILLVARDSGNVDAYHTRAIRDAIQREPYRFSKDRHSDYVGLRAFFTQWVFESAWGLAIHKEARMIAVSANTPFHVESEDPSAKITVFAFALSQPQHVEDVRPDDNDRNSHIAESDWQDWEPRTAERDADSVPSRDRNYKIVLGHGHTNNIPSISFANSRDELEGTWLFSTDIEGDMIAWNIWQNEVVNTWTACPYTSTESIFRTRRGGHGESTLVGGVARRIDGQTDRGWLVAALDPMAFAVAENITEFCGAPASTRYTRQASFAVTDIASSHVPGNSQRHPHYRQQESESDSESDDQPSDNERDVLSENEASPIEEDTNGATFAHSERLVEVPTSDDIPNQQTELRMAQALEDEDASGSNDQEHDQDRFSQHTGSSTSLSSLNAPLPGHTEVALGRLVLTADEGQRDLREHGGGIMIANAIASARTELFPSFPLLHCSMSHMRLFDAPLASKAHWFCADLLTQLMPDHFAHTAQYALDRLNMIQQIPELGLVVIASQSGRCAICSTMRQTKGGPLGLRVDWVLPTRKQEKAGLRPPHALLGIAVGPIQGMMMEATKDDQAEDGCFQDRIINGTPTSFDMNVVLMDSSEDESHGSTDEREVKRLRSPGMAMPSSAAHPKSIPRAWSHAHSVESWRGVDYSRRYRLLLTYYDWTVLTYEISREAPHLGIDRSRKNFRNRSAASAGYHNAQMQSEK